MRLVFRLILILWSLWIFTIKSSFAQEADGSRRDFGYVRESEPWLSGHNASGLTKLPDAVQKISIAEIFAIKNNGGFANYYQSDNSFKFGASTESFFRMNRQIVLYGKINYDNFTGKNMSGSAFINPDYNSFNIVESDNANSGSKNLEQYNLVGAVGVHLTPRFSVGGKVDYLTANYAKYKDLRHKNRLLDLTASLGAACQLTGAVELGINYIYRRSIESLEFGRYGTTDRLYSSLIDFGAFYGRTELFGESGYTKSNAPIVNIFHGGAIQLNADLTSKLRFFNEFSALFRNGYFGDHSASNIVFNENKGTVFAYTGNLCFENNRQRHSLKLDLCFDQLENNEAIYRYDTNSGSTSEWTVFGTTKVLDKNMTTAGLEYTANLNVRDYNPAWILRAGVNFAERIQTVSIYPFYRKQDIYRWNACFSTERRIIFSKNQYDFSLRLLYGSGGGNMNFDGAYATPSEDTRFPYSSDENLLKEYEYLTANRVEGNIRCGYSHIFSRNIRGFIRLEYGLTHAFNLSVPNKNQFNTIRLSVGCNF